MGNITLQDTDKKAFIAGLRAGLGLTNSAQTILQSPKDISAVLKSDKEFRKECEEAISYAAKMLLVMGEQFLQEQKLGKWRQNNEYIKKFISRLNLWEEICTSEQVDDSKIIDAINTGKEMQEAATLIGMSSMEMERYIFSNPVLKVYLNTA